MTGARKWAAVDFGGPEVPRSIDWPKPRSPASVRPEEEP